MENVIDNEKESRFECANDGYLSTIAYNVTSGGKVLELTHVYVPPQGRGKGIAQAMLLEVLEEVKRLGLKIVPVCPFVIQYIRRHPEWKEIVA